jgi:DNA-directed RNA polymerase specialized sigma24 family protein
MAIERDALVQILLRERVRLTATAAVVARDVHSADDIYQQVVLAALQAADSFRDTQHVLAWALRAARHRALDLAHRRRQVPLPDEVLDQMEADWVDAEPPGRTGPRPFTGASAEWPGRPGRSSASGTATG